MNGRNHYGNGYGYPSDIGQADGGGSGGGGYGSTNGLSVNGYGRDRERRPGGYGGFYNDESSYRPPTSSSSASRGDRDRDRDYNSRGRDRYGWEQDQQQQQQQSPPSWSSRDVDPRVRMRAGRDNPGYSRTRFANRSDGVETGSLASNGPRAAPQSIEDVLQMIEKNWDFMARDDCTPVQVALQLMDNSTLGKADREPEFLNMHKQIKRTLRSIVNQHHQGFNSSIGTYHKIQSSIQSSQTRIRELRNSLEESKAGLLTTKPELQGLAQSSQEYDDFLQLFNRIEEIQLLPEKLEARISEKRFLAAVDILQEGLRMMRRSEFESIGALADLRAYFANQEVTLTDILIEELHEHLYLKSPYCQDRWKSPATDSEDGSNKNLAAGTWDRPVHSFLAKLDVSTPIVEDASRNPETDTFYYMQVIIEALNRMGNLELAVDRIEQRMPVELFAVVDKTNMEVDARHPNVSRSLLKSDSKTGLTTEINEERGYVLSDFLWTLFAKFEAIAEGHRVVHDVIVGIIEREGLRRNSLGDGFKGLWKLYQSEIRSLLHDYLATDGDNSYRSAGRDGGGRRNYSLNYRDRSRKMFKLSDIDTKSDDFKKERDELDEILRSSVPGLVTKSSQKPTTGEKFESRQRNSGTGHKLLVEPSVFNMGLLLPPALSFIQRLKDIVPVDSEIVLSTLTSFLDDFLVNVFQPQLDEAVTDLCTMNFIAVDAFAEHPDWASYSPRPIFKGTVNFFSLVKAFSKMLDSIPHDQMFTQLVLNQVVTYYDKCCGWYKALVVRVSSQSSEARLKAAAAFAESGEIRDVVDELLANKSYRKDLIDKETELLIKKTNEKPLEAYDIVSDPKTVIALSLLHNSMQWLASQLAKLRYVTPSADSSKNEPNRVHKGRRWTLVSSRSASARDHANQPVYLPMSNESVVLFDNTLQSLRNLASLALRTLHVDIRCGVIHVLTKAMAGPGGPRVYDDLKDSNVPSPAPQQHQYDWHLILPTAPTSASRAVLDLNNDLVTVDTNLTSYLAPDERQFITRGLARFIDRIFISCTRFIGVMNNNGALLLQLDVLVLQQNLKNIITTNTPDGEGQGEEQIALPRSAKFLDWFLEGPEKALDYAREEKELFASQGEERGLAAGNGEPFTYDELKVLIDLCYSELIRGPRGEQNREDYLAARRSHGDAMLKLNEVMWDAK